MGTLILTLVLILLAVAGLAVGTFFGRAPIKGSCGGLACVEGADCAACAKERTR